MGRDVGRGGVGVGSELGKADPLGEGCGVGGPKGGKELLPAAPGPRLPATPLSHHPA